MWTSPFGTIRSSALVVASIFSWLSQVMQGARWVRMRSTSSCSITLRHCCSTAPFEMASAWSSGITMSECGWRRGPSSTTSIPHRCGPSWGVAYAGGWRKVALGDASRVEARVQRLEELIERLDEVHRGGEDAYLADEQ